MALEAALRPDVLLLLELSEDASFQGLDTYLSRTLQLCANWFSASGATLFLKVGDTERHKLAARAGADSRVPFDAYIEMGKGIAGTAMLRGEPQILNDRIENALSTEYKSEEGAEIGSSMIVPLRTRQIGNLGVLCLSRRVGESEFTQEDLSVAKTLAGQIALAVANARLFAETIEFQRELSEAKRLAEIGQMTAAIAHEIRNPLTGIRGAAQMVREMPGEPSELGAIIIEETDKLDRLCGEFLEFAKPYELKREPHSLGELATRVVELEQDSYPGLHLKLEISPDDPKISIDSMRIEQVCRNLILNGIQACGDGGTVAVRVRPGCLEIQDSGEGMDSCVLDSLFTPFYTTKPQGTGLGMCVVRKIVDAHGGHITVASIKGEGTTVRVELPQK